MCISVDALETGLWFPLYPLIEECLRWWRVSPSQVAPNSWRYLVVFLGECQGAGIIPTRDLFMACFRLCKSRSDWMDLGELRGMPKVASGKTPPTRPTAREVGASPAREAPKASLKKPVVSPTEQAKDAVRHHKKVKVLTRRHKSHPGEGESRSRSKGKEPATPSEEPEVPAGFEEGALHQATSNNSSAAEEFERGLLHPQLARELCILPSEVLMARAAKEMILGRLITFMDYRIKQLQEELDALKSKGGPEAVAEAEEHASELQEKLQKTKRERGEELLRREASEKELHKVRSHLGDAQWLLKEARIRSRKMDDEPLQAVKDLESARAELPRQSIVQYKDSIGFKEDLKRMGWVTYEYGYRVALARFRARHPDAEVEEDSFTIHPEDDLMLMERQQAFDDSVPPEP
ncbi:hypothetical protein B296_00056933 [Ensete ventricosum]|uniref:Transposase (putative) gypsy type domain-containing protein n=1 Tax=Ensete ventricosum TaxID=4639 RepID=A0A426WY64_ENSVE|nr:hypothetical protein B296_00056933 [Ensete ventricosum]